jgi:hypothetical protein
MDEDEETTKDAALITGIYVRTAQHYIQGYNVDVQIRFPVSHRKPRVGYIGKLTEKLFNNFFGGSK